MGALLGVLYAIVAYVLFAGTFCYTIGFIGNLAVPKSIDSGAVGRSAKRSSSTCCCSASSLRSTA